MKKRGSLTFRLPDYVGRRLIEVCEHTGISQSALVRECIIRALPGIALEKEERVKAFNSVPAII